MSEIKTIFKHGGWMDDFEVWDEEDLSSRNFSHKYHVSIEGFIWYPTLYDGIEYYKEIRSKYLEFLKEHYPNLDFEEDKNSELVYRSYDMEINKNGHGWTIYVSAPTFYELKDTYIWFNGVVEQLNKIKDNYESEENKNVRL